MQKFRIAFSTGISSEPGKKPDFGKFGTPWQELTPWQQLTKSRLTYHFRNHEMTMTNIFDRIQWGDTLTAWHTGGADCRLKETKLETGEVIPHVCKGPLHRLAINFLGAQHLGLDFDNVASVWEVVNHPLIQQYAACIYTTPSHNPPDKIRLRVIFLLDEFIEDSKLYVSMVKGLMAKFEFKPDKSCSDPLRLFYGCFNAQLLDDNNILPLATAQAWAREYQEAQEAARPQMRYYEPKPGDPRQLRFSDAVLDRAGDAIRAAQVGDRHYTMRDKLYSVACFVNGGVIDATEAYNKLLANCQAEKVAEFESLWGWAIDHAPAQGIPENVDKTRVFFFSRGYHYAI